MVSKLVVEDFAVNIKKTGFDTFLQFKINI